MKEVTVQELKEMKDNQVDFQLIDVREEYEYDLVNIDGILWPLSTIAEHVSEIAKDKKVIIHCKVGGRSGAAVRLLEEEFGFENLYNLKGGILAYINEIDPSLTKY